MKNSTLLFCFLCSIYSSHAQDLATYISEEEMILNFKESRCVSVSSFNLLYNYDETPSPAVIVENSILPALSGINPKGYIAEWKVIPRSRDNYYPSIYLRQIVVGDDKKKYEDMLAKQYGKDGLGIPASWLSGEITILPAPRDLFGKIVSKYRPILTLHNGKIVSSEYVAAKNGTMEEATIDGETTLDGYWYSNNEYKLHFLEDFVKKSLDQKDNPSVKESEFSLLLVTNEEGEANCYLLEPQRLKNRKKRALINNLIVTIEGLPLWSFGWLYTVDGSIFQGRYLKATYSSDKGWQFEDYLALSQILCK